MSDLDPKDSESETKLAVSGAEANEEDSRTPFDHPLFLPILLFLAMLWFAYDGWLTTDEKMREHQTFNRVGAGVLLFFTAMTTRTALKQMASERESAQPNSETKS